MGEIVKHWNAEECRAEDGIYFSDDTFIPIVENVSQLPRRSISELLNAKPEFWESTDCDEPLATGSGYIILGGETSWEGSGFIAVLRDDDNSLVWLFHSSVSEAFRAAAIVGDVIHATSESYPAQVEWRFPIESPWEFTAARRDA